MISLSRINSILNDMEDRYSTATLDFSIDSEAHQADMVRDISQPIDHNGNMYLADPSVMASKNLEVAEITKAWMPSNNSYCPVYVEETTEGSRHYSAYLIGPVEDVDKYIDLIDTLEKMNESDVYTIYIDSPGGYIASGGLISSAISSAKGKVYTVARGLCASAAALIHTAAKPGYAAVAPTGILMYHMSSHGDGGLSTGIRTRAENQVRYVNEVLLRRAVNLGYLLPEEFERLQGGDDIFVCADEFKRRASKHYRLEEHDESIRKYMG